MKEMIEVIVSRRSGIDKVIINENPQRSAPLGIFVRINNNVLNEFIPCAGSNAIVFTWIRDNDRDVYENVGGIRFLDLNIDKMRAAILGGIELNWLSCSCSFK